MISRYSVKRPYTVVVAVVLVIILGVVSFLNMKTDLLPDMTLPYAIVMTTYPGASPEEVETMVTRPVEQAMATISNIENVTSVSSENVSQVILEFSQSANMDAVTIEMRESLDQIKGYWEDSVGSPIIMKLNPDMMPIMVAAVEAGDMSSLELTELVKNKLLPDLESIEGVASASTSGDVKEDVKVIISQEKVDAVNQKIIAALDAKFGDTKAEMDKAQSKIDDGKKQLESGQQELADQTANAEAQISSGKDELLKNEVQIDTALASIAEKQQTLEMSRSVIETLERKFAQGQEELAAKEKELAKSEAELEKKAEELKDAASQMKSLPEQLKELETQIQQITDAEAALTQAKEKLPVLRKAEEELTKALEQLRAMGDLAPSDKVEELEKQLKQTEAGILAIEDALKKMGIEESQIDEKLKELGDTKTRLIQSKTLLEKASQASSGMDQTAVGEALIEEGKKQAAQGKEQIEVLKSQLEALQNQITNGKAQLDEGSLQLETAKVQLETAKEQIATGQATVAEALGELNRQKVTAAIELAAGKAELNNGEKELKSAKDQLNSQRDAAYDQADLDQIVTTDMVKGILAAQNFTMPAGYVTEDGVDYLVRVGDKITEVEDLSGLVLMDMHIDGIDPVKLSDVADVAVTDNSDEVYAKINGHAGILFTMQKQSGYSTGEVSDRIKARFEELTQANPQAHFITLMDQGVYIDLVVDSVLQNMIMGGILAILVLFLFLKSFRPTLVIAFSIPISIMTAIVLMYFTGITLNVISLSGLALGVGMLVDNSIVVIENIYRLRTEGLPVKKAAVEGAHQVAGAIAASTLTTICVFAPIVFTKGITRQLFVDMGLTIAFSLLASLVVALTLVPMMGAGLLKNTAEKQSKVLDRLIGGYGKIIKLALRFKPVVLIGSIVLLILSGVLAVSRGTAFMADMESTQMNVSLTMPDEATLKDTGEMSDKVMEEILNIPDVTDVGAMAGNSGIGMMGAGKSKTNKVTMYVLLSEKKKATNEKIAQEIKNRTKGFPCEIEVETSSMDMSALGGSGVSIKVKGRELDTIKEIATDVAEIVTDVKGTQDISDGIEEKTQEMRLVVDKMAASEYQLTVAQVFQYLQGKLAEAKSATTISADAKDYSVIVMDGGDKALTRDEIKKLRITGKDAEGKEKDVPLMDIVKFVDTEGFTSINREAQTRYVTVTAGLDKDANIGIVSDEINKKLAEYEVPKGYTVEMAGEDQTINESMTEVYKMLGLAVVFMYLIMVAQFQSLLSPFIIMFTIPLAFTGGLLGLFFTNNPVSVIAMIGFVMLSGIIVNNGIVLVDYINQLRKGGMEKREAIVEAGMTRLRPIIMTALTTVLGLSTMAMGIGMGSDMVQPMAIVTIGGLIYGTLLTLIVVPCIYDLFNRKEDITEEEI
ncbi:MAG: efflux RND transporter permease subunit [Clostridiales bacterium]|nr:efflux RND transporter permease subunit [Clostridiales bacterium]MDU3239918.1 efflux RND transporter permease subunit [Clostridiales bacterium]